MFSNVIFNWKEVGTVFICFLSYILAEQACIGEEINKLEHISSLVAKPIHGFGWTFLNKLRKAFKGGL